MRAASVPVSPVANAAPHPYRESERAPGRRSAHAFLLPGALVSLAVGCFDQGSGRGNGADSTQREPPKLAWTANLPLLPEDKPRSILYRQAMLRWRTATVAFSSRQFDEAAASFLEVAKILRTNRPHPHASTFAVARCLAYENAGRALSGLPDRQQAKQRLVDAVADDTACPLTVRRTLNGLAVTPAP